MKGLPILYIAAIGSLGVISFDVSATNLNLFAGSNIGSQEQGLIVAEFTTPMIAEVGPFFEWSRDSVSGTESRFTGGLMGRMTSPWLNFFGDVRAGYNWNLSSDASMRKEGFNLEFGAGYRFVMTALDLIPRIGFSAVTANNDIPLVNLSLGVAFVL